MSNTGWTCPRCDTVNAPSVKRCDSCSPNQRIQVIPEPPRVFIGRVPHPDVSPRPTDAPHRPIIGVDITPGIHFKHG